MEPKRHRAQSPPTSPARAEGGAAGMDDEERSRDPVTFEQRHVHDVYSHIAKHFSATRYRAWPRVAAFVQCLKPASLLIDVGCGNGKNLGLCRHVTDIGCDVSSQLLALARDEKGHECLRADALRTPFRSGIADAVLSIAVIHHFASRERRTAALAELARLVRPGGRILVYVWAVEQKRKTRPEGEQQQDVLIDWQVHDKFKGATGDDSRFSRYYHLFGKGELEELVGTIPRLRIVQSYFDKENWAVELVAADVV